MSEERTSTYINTYILPKGLDYSLFIFPHSFNGYFLDVVFLELQHHMNNQVIETENIETWAKIIKMGSWAGQPFILKKQKEQTCDRRWSTKRTIVSSRQASTNLLNDLSSTNLIYRTSKKEILFNCKLELPDKKDIIMSEQGLLHFWRSKGQKIGDK